jgi:uncharacterized protein (DUF427 family)
MMAGNGTDAPAVAAGMTDRGRVRVESAAKRVRASLGGGWVFDTVRPLFVWEKPYHPTYYIPLEDVAEHALEEAGEVRHSPSRGDAVVYDVRRRDRLAPGAAYRYVSSPIGDIRHAVAFEWDAMDNWFEEDEQVFVHPRDPYKRVDVLRSSRHVVVRIDGEVVADSESPVLLFETGLPTRFYLPMTDVRMDLLEPTGTATSCPYKGTARYWSVGAHRDIAWSYPFPVRESSPIAGLVCFYNEKVDVAVDGVEQERPTTNFG